MHLMSTASTDLLSFEGKEENKIQQLFLSVQEKTWNRKKCGPCASVTFGFREKLVTQILVFPQLESKQTLISCAREVLHIQTMIKADAKHTLF